MLPALLAFMLAGPLQAASVVEPEETAPEPWAGPGRFCGYVSVVDLQPGEQIVADAVGIHTASYVWSGPFGAITVRENNWAARPKNIVRRISKENGAEVFELRGGKSERRYVILGGDHLAAYLSSPMFGKSKADLGYIRRIILSDHAGAKGTDCKYRTYFSWE